MRGAFLAAVNDKRRTEFEALDDLDKLLETAWQHSVDSYGDIELSPAELAAGLAAWIPDSGTARDCLDAIDAAEAYLVTAVIANRPGALRCFQERYFQRAIAALVSMSMSRDEIDDVLQIVSVRLLVADGDGVRRLEQYAGRGDLRTLIRVVATRAAIDLKRRQKRHVAADDELAQLPVADPDPRLVAIRRQCRDHFAPAFSSAVAALESRERNLLRLHIVDGVPLHVLGRSYGVHKTTVVRWLVKAREQLVGGIVSELSERSSVSPDEAAEIAAAIRSQVQLSLSRLLRTASNAT